MSAPVLILGCGYTGRRVARMLRSRGVDVVATSRTPEKLADLDVTAVQLEVREENSIKELRHHLLPGMRVLHSIPTIFEETGPKEYTQALMDAVSGAASRIVYLSTTGVYGDQAEVDERSPAAPVTERQRLRVEAEQAVAAGPASWMTLRSAAIYGPGRGIHVALQRGLWDKIDLGDNNISRIHVDDLAAHAVAALDTKVEGAWPVADDEPCTSRQMAEFSSELLGILLPEGTARPPQIDETRRADRKVDGSAVRKSLGIELIWPSYRVGVPGSL